MFTLILYLPLMNWLMGSLLGRWLSTKGSSLIIVVSMFLTTLLSWYSFYYVCFKSFKKCIKGITIRYITWLDRDWNEEHGIKHDIYPHLYEFQWWLGYPPETPTAFTIGKILDYQRVVREKLYQSWRDFFFDWFDYYNFIFMEDFLAYTEYGLRNCQWWWDNIQASMNKLGFNVRAYFHEYDAKGELIQYDLPDWINIDGLQISYGLIFDRPTVSMLILVTTVSFCVHLYSLDYMGNDPHLPRFLSYLSLFTFFMIVLVTADNLLQLFIGWEGVGVCSYLLINFWFTRIQANKAAIKAMIMNRIGDMGILLAMFFIYDMFNTLQFNSIFAILSSNDPYFGIFNKYYQIFNLNVSGFEIIGMLLLIGAIGKSAQIGLHTWLPDAMEGPTPVSALIHAATMVTAGVFLLIRCSPILEHAPITLNIITIIGASTAFLAATIGAFQYDIKKVIAYSTCSQLGYMVFTCGLSAYSVSLFHLLNHGFFKALLFLSAGNIIHALADEQDMRKLGGLIKNLPITYSFMLIGSLSLMGFPYMTGYYSKDTIIELTQGPLTTTAWYAYWLGIYSAFFTAFYSMRLIYYTFLSQPNCNIKDFKNVHEVTIIPIVSLTILTIFSIFFGYLFKDTFIGIGGDFFLNALPSNGYTNFTVESEFLNFFDKNIPFFLSVFGAVLAIIINNKFNYQFTNIQIHHFSKLFTFFNNKWNFDQVYNNLITKKLLYISHDTTFKNLDKGLFEIAGPTGINRIIKALTKNLTYVQSGVLYNYVLIILLFLFLLLYFSQTTFTSINYLTILITILYWLLLNKK